MAQTGIRKDEHIKICLEKKVQAKRVTTGFEGIHFVHHALPEINRKDIKLFTSFLGKKLSAPIIVGAMTGGTEQALKINSSIAEAVEKLGLGMGVGSQRAAIEDHKLEKTFSIARKKAPNAFLIANIGGVQFTHGYGLKEVKKIIEMIDADALAIHLNALQEAVQPEGQTDFKGVLAKICEIAGNLDKPVIVKETGAGISAETAKALEDAGVKAIDVSGAGGTSFSAVEYYRSKSQDSIQQDLAEVFWDWGIPTAVSIIEITQTVKLPVIASGGIRNGHDVAKALALDACIASIAQPILEFAIKGSKETETKLTKLIEELRTAMFLVGAEKISDLQKTPIVVMGQAAEGPKTRGFNTEKYAKRGAKA